MSIILPPSELRAALDERALDRKHLMHLPSLESCDPAKQVGTGTSRRAFLTAAGAALAAFSLPRGVKAADQLIFSPDSAVADTPTPATTAPAAIPPASTQQLRLGEIPRDFWQRPRSLRLKRQATGEYLDLVYWKDGKLIPENYMRICALMRDVRANKMTYMDPLMLDVLRGVLGYYEAWKWPHPLVITSGYRTPETNNKLSKEGAAKNSMHLYGKATDLYMPGVPAKDIGLLGVYMAQGGVGFYPGRGFTHLDTGRLRTWRG